MLIYFLVFFTNILLLICAENSFKKKKRKLGVIFSILIITNLSLLAAFRTIDIGDDTKGYINSVYNQASLQKGYSLFIENMFDSNIEFLYASINYLICWVGGSINFLYFIISFIPLLFLYLTCYDNRDENGNYILPFICFTFLFFNKSLNMCRQTISICILMYSIKYIFKNQVFKYFLCNIIAMGFHIFSIISIPIFFLIKTINKPNKPIRKIFIFILLFLFIFLYQYLINFIVNDLNILDQKYIYYGVNSKGINNIPIFEYIFVIIASIFSLLFYNKNKYIINDKEKTYTYFVIITPIIYSLGLFGNYAFRISYYFYYFIIFVIPLYNKYNRNLYAKKIITLLIIAFLTIYSYTYYGYIGYDHTTPYKCILYENQR